MCRDKLPANVPLMLGAAVALTTVLMQSQNGIAYEPNCGGEPTYASEPYCAGYPPPAVISALDMPLTWYFMPRRPGCASHDFHYRRELPEPCPVNLAGCGADCCGSDFADACPVAPGLLDGFTPLEFERLGQIPNDSLLEAAAGQ